MTDQHLDGEPWDDDSIPVGIDARRIYEYATTVGGKRRRRRRQRNTAVVGALAATIAVAAPGGGLVLANNSRSHSEVDVASPSHRTAAALWSRGPVLREGGADPGRRILGPMVARRRNGHHHLDDLDLDDDVDHNFHDDLDDDEHNHDHDHDARRRCRRRPTMPCSPSQTNFSAAPEHPTWSLSCDTATKAWSFSIHGVRLLDSKGQVWLPKNGPWYVDVWSADAAGPVPWSVNVRLKKNAANGLFDGAASGKDAKIDLRCKTGSGATVTAFSDSEQSLLLDGTFG